MCLKADQMPKPESYNSNYFIFCHNDCEVSSRNMAFTLQSNPQSRNVRLHVFDQFAR